MPDRKTPESAAKRLRTLTRPRPRLALVLGSGFREAAAILKVEARIPYEKLPGFPSAKVDGHQGELLVGQAGGVPVLALSGRAHYYEGHTMQQVTFAVRVLAAFGIRDLLLTNAAGGINRKFHAGDFMLIQDHINFMGCNPLRGIACPVGSPFVDLTQTYDKGLQRLLRRAARQARVGLRAGVYLAVSGPSYETPAEIRAFRRLGADAVGMSTVPEAIVARHCGLNVAGLSCVTNQAAGTSHSTLSHQEVLNTAARVEKQAGNLMFNFMQLYGAE